MTKTQTLGDKVFDQLLERIHYGEFAPGHPLKENILGATIWYKQRAYKRSNSSSSGNPIGQQRVLFKGSCCENYTRNY